MPLAVMTEIKFCGLILTLADKSLPLAETINKKVLGVKLICADKLLPLGVMTVINAEGFRVMGESNTVLRLRKVSALTDSLIPILISNTRPPAEIASV